MENMALPTRQPGRPTPQQLQAVGAAIRQAQKQNTPAPAAGEEKAARELAQRIMQRRYYKQAGVL